MKSLYTIFFCIGLYTNIYCQTSPTVQIGDTNGPFQAGDHQVSENSTRSGLGSLTLILDAPEGYAPTGTTLSITDDTGITNITLAQLNALSTTPITISGGNDGELKFTNFNSVDGKLTYEFDPTGINRDHSAGDFSVIEMYLVTLTDALGATGSDIIDFLITDTAPTAAADSVTFNEDTTAYAFGDVLSGGNFCGGFGTGITCFLGADTSGADTAIEVIDYSFNGNSVMGNTVNNDLIIDNIISRRNFSRDGTFGFRILSETDQIQELDNGDRIERIIQYTITDTDGDTSTSTLRIIIEGADEPANVQAIRDTAGTTNSVTAAQLNAIDGVSGALVEREVFYQNAIENVTGEDIDIASEIQALVDTVNAWDIINPRLASVTRQNPTTEITNADSVTLRYTFDEAVIGVTTSNFTTTSPASTISITPVSTSVYDVTYGGPSIVDHIGMVTFPFNASGITDTSSNPITNAAVVGANENTYDFQNIAISISSPSESIANASSVITYTILFFGQNSLSVTNSDIILNTTGDATATVNVSNGIIANQKVITFSNISSNGTLGFSIAAGVASNSAGFQSDASADSATFTVDTSKPTVLLSSSENNPTTTSPITVNVTFSEPISDFIESSFNVTNATVSNINGAEKDFTISVTPTGFGLVEVELKANETTDTAGNQNEASNTFSITYQDATLSTNEFYIERLRIPNPVKNIISLPEGFKTNNISIYNIEGQLVSNSLNIMNLNAGIYLLKISDLDGKEFTFKIIH